MLLDDDVTTIELKELAGRCQDLFEFSPSPIFILDEHGIIIKANMACEKLLNIDINSLLSMKISRYIEAEFQAPFARYLTLMAKKRILQACEVKLLKRFMPIFYAHLLGKASVNVRTGHIEFMIIVQSVSHRRYLEESIDPLSSDSSNSVSDSAHLMMAYLNQPLAVIGNYINGCIHRLESGKFEAANLLQGMKHAEHELHRTAEIIMRMKNFSCKNNFKYESVCLNIMIEEIIDLMNIEIIHYPVEIQFRPAKGLPNIILDKIYVQQAILNLVRNAIEAMCDSETADPKVTIEINRLGGNCVAISIIDLGPGFKLENTHKLFDPHYTTKSYGTGLGLLMSRIIVESHGGALNVELNPVRGACMTIELPMVPLMK